jgi:hypothetical protein
MIAPNFAGSIVVGVEYSLEGYEIIIVGLEGNKTVAIALGGLRGGGIVDLSLRNGGHCLNP